MDAPAGINPFDRNIGASNDPSGFHSIGSVTPDDDLSQPFPLPSVISNAPPPPTPRRSGGASSTFGNTSPSPVMAFLVGTPPPPPASPPPNKNYNKPRRTSPRNSKLNFSSGRNEASSSQSPLNSSSHHSSSASFNVAKERILGNRRRAALTTYENSKLYLRDNGEEYPEEERALVSSANARSTTAGGSHRTSIRTVENTQIVDRENESPNPIGMLASPRSAATEPHSNKRERSTRLEEYSTQYIDEAADVSVSSISVRSGRERERVKETERTIGQGREKVRESLSKRRKSAEEARGRRRRTSTEGRQRRTSTGGGENQDGRRSSKTPERNSNRRTTRAKTPEKKGIQDTRVKSPENNRGPEPSDKEKRRFFRFFRGGKSRKSTDRGTETASKSSSDDESTEVSTYSQLQKSREQFDKYATPHASKNSLKVTFREIDDVLIDQRSPANSGIISQNKEKEDAVLSSKETEDFTLQSHSNSSVSSSAEPNKSVSTRSDGLDASNPEPDKNTEGESSRVESISHSVPEVEDDHPEVFFSQDEVSTLTTPSIVSGRRSLEPSEDTFDDDQSSDPLGHYWDRAKASSSASASALTSIEEQSFREPDGDSPVKKKKTRSAAARRGNFQMQDPVGDSPGSNTRTNRLVRVGPSEPTPRGVDTPADFKTDDGPTPRGVVTPADINTKDEPTPRGVGNSVDFKAKDEPTPRGVGNPGVFKAKDEPTPRGVGTSADFKVKDEPTPRNNDTRADPKTQDPPLQEATLHDDMGEPIPVLSAPAPNLIRNKTRPDGEMRREPSAYQDFSKYVVDPPLRIDVGEGKGDEYGASKDLSPKKRSARHTEKNKGIRQNISPRQQSKNKTSNDRGSSENISPRKRSSRPTDHHDRGATIEMDKNPVMSSSMPLTKITHRTIQKYSPRALRDSRSMAFTGSYKKGVAKNSGEPRKFEESMQSRKPLRDPSICDTSEYSATEETEDGVSHHTECEDDAQKNGEKVGGKFKSNPLLSMSAAARMNAKAFAYLHTLNGEPSPRQAWRRTHLADDDYGPKKAVTNPKTPPRVIRVFERYRDGTAGDDDLSSHADNSSQMVFSTYSSKFRGRKPKRNNVQSRTEQKYSSGDYRGAKSILLEQVPKPQTIDRDVKVAGVAVGLGIELKRRQREGDIASGAAFRVIPHKRKKKPASSKSSQIDETDIKDPIQRAGRRLLSKAAIPIQSAARRYLARREGTDRMWALVVIQSYFRRWRCEAFKMAHSYLSTRIQSTFRGWKLRDHLADQHYAATQFQKIVRGYIAAAKVYDSIYWITRLQSVVRGKLARIYTVKKKKADRQGAIIIQCAIRCYMSRKQLLKRFDAICLIQAIYRSYTTRIQYQLTFVDIITTQSIARQYLARKIYKKHVLCKMNVSASKIQAAWRGFQRYTEYIFTLVDILVLQRNFRKWLAIKRLNSLREESAAIKIQTTFRRHMAQLIVLIDLVHIIIAQSVIRRHLVQPVYRKMQKEREAKMHEEEKHYNAATKIQRVWRGFWQYSHFVIMQYEVVRLQAIVRGRIARNSFRMCLGCCLMIQSVARRFLASKLAYKRRMAAVSMYSATQGMREKLSIQKIQFWWKVVLDCRKEKKAALIIERFFIQVKKEVEREMNELIRRDSLKKSPKRSKRRRRKKKEPDDKTPERIWLNTVDEDRADIFEYSSTCGDSVTTSRSKSAPRLRSDSTYLSESSSNNSATGENEEEKTSDASKINVASATTKDAIMQHDHRRGKDPPTESVKVDPSEDESVVSGITTGSNIFNRVARQRSKLSQSAQSEVSEDLSLEEAYLDIEVLEKKEKRSSTADYAKKFGLKSAPRSTRKKKHFFADDSDPSDVQNNRNKSGDDNGHGPPPESPTPSQTSCASRASRIEKRIQARQKRRSKERRHAQTSPTASVVTEASARSLRRPRSRGRSAGFEESSINRSRSRGEAPLPNESLINRSHSRETHRTEETSKSRSRAEVTRAASEASSSRPKEKRTHNHMPPPPSPRTPFSKENRTLNMQFLNRVDKYASSGGTPSSQSAFPEAILHKDSMDNVEIEYVGGTEFGMI